MMAMETPTEWKPGDVAMVTLPGSDVEVIGLNIEGTCWHSIRRDGGLRCTVADSVEAIRPLVVIDPEDAEQVERLLRLWVNTTPASAAWLALVDKLTTALREFANPTPRIEEPQGLGAVVEDERAQRWVRLGDRKRPWVSGYLPINPCAWDEIEAVRVLSEGVTP